MEMMLRDLIVALWFLVFGIAGTIEIIYIGQPMTWIPWAIGACVGAGVGLLIKAIIYDRRWMH